MLDQNSTAREVAASYGCSLPTVMLKAKSLGIKFKGRTADQHAALMVALATVSPRPRKSAEVKKTLAEQVDAHLADGKVLIEAAKDELAQLEAAAADVEAAKAAVQTKLDLLTEEQTNFKKE